MSKKGASRADNRGGRRYVPGNEPPCPPIRYARLPALQARLNEAVDARTANARVLSGAWQ